MSIGDPSSGKQLDEGGKRKKWPWIAGGVAGGLILIGALNMNDESPKPAAEVTTSTAVSTTPAAKTTTPAPTTTTTAPVTTAPTTVAPAAASVAPTSVAPPAATEAVVVPVAPPEPEAPPVQRVVPEPEPEPEVKAPAPRSVSYANCAAVRAAGAAPIYSGDPGYSKKLDRDGDGVACE